MAALKTSATESISVQRCGGILKSLTAIFSWNYFVRVSVDRLLQAGCVQSRVCEAGGCSGAAPVPAPARQTWEMSVGKNTGGG